MALGTTLGTTLGMALQMSLQQLGLHHVGVAHQRIHIIVVGTSLFGRHAEILQTFARLLQARHRGVGLDILVLQVLHPLFQRTDGQCVELVDTDDEIFGEHVLRVLHMQIITLMSSQLQRVVRMHTHQRCLTMIQVVGPLAQIEIDDIDGIDFLDMIVALTAANMLGHGLGHTIEHTLQIVQLARLLNLDQHYFAL